MWLGKCAENKKNPSSYEISSLNVTCTLVNFIIHIMDDLMYMLKCKSLYISGILCLVMNLGWFVF